MNRQSEKCSSTGEFQHSGTPSDPKNRNVNTTAEFWKLWLITGCLIRGVHSALKINSKIKYDVQKLQEGKLIPMSEECFININTKKYKPLDTHGCNAAPSFNTSINRFKLLQASWF
jgi:hypothetical protein